MYLPLVDCQNESQYIIAEVKQKMKDESEWFLLEYGLTKLYYACLAQELAKVLIVRVCGKPFLGAIQGNSFGIAFGTATEKIGAESSSIVLGTLAVSSFTIRLIEKF
ncbi:hypothetical protein COCNU_14G002550 [Cocos nucifera]|uniref:Uncharacterized protein n=1 Tax=Cocos nucifera TaxID=13894 RepID=A0A8K0IU94_COCNU|nr:hypothetical protein COCNU_14G002550 [Cocos nucifera]